MKDTLESLLREAVAKKWNLDNVEFVIHPFLFWTQLGGLVQYTPDGDTARGQRGVFEFEGHVIRVYVDSSYKEKRVTLYKDRATSGSKLAQNYDNET